MPLGILDTTVARLQGRIPLLWLIPVGIAAAAFVLPEKLRADTIGAALALLLLVYLVKRPGVALIALVIFLPIELFAFSLLLSVHVPQAILRPSSGLKELLVAALVIAGIRQIRDSRRRLDRIDIAVLAYVGVVTVYLIVPHLFSSYAPTQWSPRFLAWRSDAGYPLLFFGVRHAPIYPKIKERLLQVVLAMGGLVAVLGLYQRLAPQAWSHFVLYTAHVPVYELRVLGLPGSDVGNNLRYVLTTSSLRVSSLFLSPFDMSDYLLIVLAVAAVRITHGHRSIFTFAVAAATVGALFFSRSRADGLAALIVLILIALPTSRSPIEGRLRLIGALVVGAVILVPALAGTRFLGGEGGGSSAVGHVTEIEHGIQAIEYFPLGLGLGYQPGTSNRFVELSNAVYGNVSDNTITQVGDELGIQALLPWLIMMGLIFLELKRRASTGDIFAASFGLALLGVFIAGQYHHAFLTYPVPWTLWAGVGLALSYDGWESSPDSGETAISYPSSAGVR